MPRKKPSKRLLSAIDTLTTTPPAAPLPATQTVAQVISNAGNNLYKVRLPPPSPSPSPSSPSSSSSEVLVELQGTFRSKAWLRRGGYVIVDMAALGGGGGGRGNNKIAGEIVNVVREEREWRKMSYWPVEFTKRVDEEDGGGEGSEEEEESVVGKLPPTSDDES